MAISNKFGGMVVTTGNKSEMSVGYATLYGDMNGGFNPIKDLYKTEVYRPGALAQSLEARRRARAGRAGHSGERHHRRAPTRGAARQPDRPGYAAALRRCSIDILERLVERERADREIVAAGFDRDTVMKVERMLYLAEYKRRQARPA